MAVGGAARLLSLLGRLKPAASAASKAASKSGAAKGLGNIGMRGGKFSATAAVGDTYRGLGQLTARVAPVAIAAGAPVVGAGLAVKGASDVLGPNVANAIDGKGFVIGDETAGVKAVTSGNYDSDRDQLSGFGLADQVRAGLGLGPSKSDVISQAQTELNRQFQQTGSANFLREGGNGFQLTDGFLDRRAGETAQEYENRLKPEVDRLKAFKVAAGNPDIQTPLTGYESVADLTRLTKTAADARFDSPLQVAIRAQEQQTQLMRQQLAQTAYQNKLADHNFALSNARLDFQQEQAEKNRQQTLQFKLFDRQDARADRAEREAVRDRADRRAAISSMVKGLSQLGYAFAL